MGGKNEAMAAEENKKKKKGVRCPEVVAPLNGMFHCLQDWNFPTFFILFASLTASLLNLTLSRHLSSSVG